MKYNWTALKRAFRVELKIDRFTRNTIYHTVTIMQHLNVFWIGYIHILVKTTIKFVTRSRHAKERFDFDAEKWLVIITEVMQKVRPFCKLIFLSFWSFATTLTGYRVSNNKFCMFETKEHETCLMNLFETKGSFKMTNS